MAKRFWLEFEKPIMELEQRLSELELFGSSNDVDVEQATKLLREKIQQTRLDVYKNMTPFQRVQMARHVERPFTLDYIRLIFTDFIELHGDRRFRDDQAMIGGFATLDGRRLMVIGQQKGRDVAENTRHNFGCANPEGYRKAIRLMKMADKAGIPIITLIDTPGAFPGRDAEERHIAEAIAYNLREMFVFGVPIICTVIGEGGSGGALGIGVGNRVLMMENAYYSVITPEGCSAILWKDSTAKEQAAASLKLTCDDLMKLGIIDGVIPEPMGGANQDPERVAASLKAALLSHLDDLSTKTPDELKTERYERFRKLGVFRETSSAALHK